MKKENFPKHKFKYADHSFFSCGNKNAAESGYSYNTLKPTSQPASQPATQELAFCSFKLPTHNETVYTICEQVKYSMFPNSNIKLLIRAIRPAFMYI